MKFNYQYRTSDNLLHDGVIQARSREDAFSKLKASGIHPCRLCDAPGVVNFLVGRCKRWIAIAALSAITAFLVLRSVLHERSDFANADMYSQSLPRHYVEIPSGTHLRELFEDQCDAYLCQYAVPGRRAETQFSISTNDLVAAIGKRVSIDESDPNYLKELKMIVIGIKAEMRQAINSRVVSPEQYIMRLSERQEMEAEYREQAVKRYKMGLIDKQEVNSVLTAMGLQVID